MPNKDAVLVACQTENVYNLRDTILHTNLKNNLIFCTVTATEFRQLFYCQFCSLSFIIIMTDIQNFCDRNSVMHNKNQNATSNVFD
jgi:hypothetical protein